MTVEELIRELSDAEGFYNEVKLVEVDRHGDYYRYSKEYNYHVEIDNGDVYIVMENK